VLYVLERDHPHFHATVGRATLGSPVGLQGVVLPVGVDRDPVLGEGRRGDLLQVDLDREGAIFGQDQVGLSFSLAVGVAVDLYPCALGHDQQGCQLVQVAGGAGVELCRTALEADLPAPRSDHLTGGAGGLGEVRSGDATTLDAFQLGGGQEVLTVEHVVERGIGRDVLGPEIDGEVAVVLVGALEGVARRWVNSVELECLVHGEGLASAESHANGAGLVPLLHALVVGGPVLRVHDGRLVDGEGRFAAVGEGFAAGADLEVALETTCQPVHHLALVGLVPLADAEDRVGHLPTVLFGGEDLRQATLETGDVHVAGGPCAGACDANILRATGELATLDLLEVVALVLDVGLVALVEAAGVQEVQRVGIPGVPVGIHWDVVECCPSEGHVDVAVTLHPREALASAEVRVVHALGWTHEGVLAQRPSETADDLGAILRSQLGELTVESVDVPGRRIAHHGGVRVAGRAVVRVCALHLRGTGDETVLLVSVHVLAFDAEVDPPLLHDGALQGAGSTVGVVHAGHGVPGDDAPVDLGRGHGRRAVPGDGHSLAARADALVLEAVVQLDVAVDGHRLGALGCGHAVEGESTSEHCRQNSHYGEQSTDRALVYGCAHVTISSNAQNLLGLVGSSCGEFPADSRPAIFIRFPGCGGSRFWLCYGKRSSSPAKSACRRRWVFTGKLHGCQFTCCPAPLPKHLLASSNVCDVHTSQNVMSFCKANLDISGTHLCGSSEFCDGLSDRKFLLGTFSQLTKVAA